jgi:hypothetical protein
MHRPVTCYANTTYSFPGTVNTTDGSEELPANFFRIEVKKKQRLGEGTTGCYELSSVRAV